MLYSTQLYTLGENGRETEVETKEEEDEEEEENSVQLIFKHFLLYQISEGNYCFLSMHYSIILLTYSYILICTALSMYYSITLLFTPNIIILIYTALSMYYSIILLIYSYIMILIY